MGNTFGQLFRVTTWGESHGEGVGVVIDGCPPRVKLTEIDIQPDLDRRRPGQSRITTQRKETDRVKIVSGTFEGKTLGTPISMVVANTDQRSEAYMEMKDKYRPSHADYTYDAKFGVRAWPGGGRTSARETIARVAAGAVARKILKEQFGVTVLSCVQQVQKIAADINPDKFTLKQVESNIIRCPDKKAAVKMIRLVDRTRKAGDSVGGVLLGVARGVPAAQDGTLAIMVGGSDQVFARIKPYLDCMGTEISHCGDVGTGQVLKLMNNMLVFQNVSAIAEAMAIATRAGVERGRLFEILSRGSADSFVMRKHGKCMTTGEYPDDQFSTVYSLKDIRYALDLAEKVGVDAAGAKLAESRLLDAIDRGWGQFYSPVIYKLLED